MRNLHCGLCGAKLSVFQAPTANISKKGNSRMADLDYEDDNVDDFDFI